MARKELPEVNASSLADIAFLLLTFFLIATSMDKQAGIQRKLPDLSNPEEVTTVVEQQNAIEFIANAYGQILYKQDPSDQRLINVMEVRQLVIDHVDNGGGVNADGERCDYCQGQRRADLSSHPQLAIVSIKFDKATDWANYMALQGEVDAAYDFLRKRYVQTRYGRDLDFMTMDPSKENNVGDNAIITDAGNKYPKIIAEPKPVDAAQ
ncbi:MAG: biopolymer transporter ExbD [Weeksellaceae bacterium]|nr:biopolymer transporter ExbD [Weeksellaceae bacterium]